MEVAVLAGAVREDNSDPTAAVATVKADPNTDVTTPAPEVARVKPSPASLVMIVKTFPPTAIIF